MINNFYCISMETLCSRIFSVVLKGSASSVMLGVSVLLETASLFSFRTSRGQGYSAHFEGCGLIVTSLKAKGQRSQHCMKYDFKPQKVSDSSEGS